MALRFYPMSTTVRQGEQGRGRGHVPGLHPPNRRVCNHRCTGSIRAQEWFPDAQVLQRHGHPGNLVIGRGAVTAAIGHDHAVGRDAVPVDSPSVHVRLVMSRYIRLVRFSFLILIGRFVTLESMKIKSVTPMHHLMIMVSSATPAPRRRRA